MVRSWAQSLFRELLEDVRSDGSGEGGTAGEGDGLEWGQPALGSAVSVGGDLSFLRTLPGEQEGASMWLPPRADWETAGFPLRAERATCSALCTGGGRSASYRDANLFWGKMNVPHTFHLTVQLG